MRSSERVAAFAVAAMTAPALLVFPILGLWYVMRIWPGMGLVDRTMFCCAVVFFVVSTPICFLRGIRLIEQGHSEGMTTVGSVLILTPLLAGGWALTHRLDILLSMAVWELWNMYRAHKRQRETSPGQATPPISPLKLPARFKSCCRRYMLGI